MSAGRSPYGQARGFGNTGCRSGASSCHPFADGDGSTTGSPQVNDQVDRQVHGGHHCWGSPPSSCERRRGPFLDLGDDDQGAEPTGPHIGGACPHWAARDIFSYVGGGTALLLQPAARQHPRGGDKVFRLLLTSKFGKPRNRHQPRVSIDFRVLESADGNYQVANSRILSRFG